MVAKMTKRETMMMYFLKRAHNTINKVSTIKKKKKMEPQSAPPTSKFSLQFTEKRGQRNVLYNSMEIKLAKPRQWETLQDK